MTVQVIEHAGFCFGVQRAVSLLEEEIAAGHFPLYTVGPIIHNPQIVAEMETKGVRIAESVYDLPDGAFAVIRAHGIPREDLAYLEERGIRFVNATCPFVERIQKIVEENREHPILIGGNPDHPEVRGIRSCGGRETFVFRNAEELQKLLIENGLFSSN